MPSKKGTEQALTWLKSKMAERDTLDAVNAELCYNIITDLQKKRKVIGALYHQTYTRNRMMRDEIAKTNSSYGWDEPLIFEKSIMEE